MRKFAIAMALVVAAGAAQAKEANTGTLWTGHNTGVGAGFSSRVVSTLNINVTGIRSNDPYGNAINVVNNYNIGANSHVIGIGWDVTLFADTPSWLSELSVAFEDSGQTTGVFLSPGAGDDFSGTSVYSSGGVVDLVGLALDFNVGPDGILRLEYFEGYDDFPGDWDGIWQAGALTVQYDTVPAPGAAGVLAVGGLMALRRRR